MKSLKELLSKISKREEEGEKTIEFHLRMSESVDNALEDLGEKLGSKDKAETLRDCICVTQWVCNQLDQGREILSVEKKE